MSNFLTVIRVFGLYGQRTGVLVQTVGPSLPPPPCAALLCLTKLASLL